VKPIQGLKLRCQDWRDGVRGGVCRSGATWGTGRRLGAVPCGQNHVDQWLCARGEVGCVMAGVVSTGGKVWQSGDMQSSGGRLHEMWRSQWR
jgi:hypothetical protein